MLPINPSRAGTPIWMLLLMTGFRPDANPSCCGNSQQLNIAFSTIMAPETERIWQPIDPEFEHKLDVEYVRFHKANLLHRPRADQIPWSPAIRDTPAVIGTSSQLHVGSIVDYELTRCKVRVFTPEGEPPIDDGWPALIFFHGGK